MKQNLQPPATPLEMLSLFFPAGLLDYFDLVNHVSQETCFIFFLEEKPSIPQEHSHLHLHSKGFFPEIEVQDFPVRGKALTEMLKQPLYQPKTDAEQVVILVLASHGMLDEVPLAEQRARTAAFVRQFHADVSGTMDAITATGKLTPEQTDTILNAWKAYEGGESHGVQ